MIIQGQLRAFREAVSMKYKTEVGPDHVLMGRMVRHCAWVVNNFQVKGTGRTPHRSIWSKDYTIQQKDELESGRRAKKVCSPGMRQNILDKHGRTAGCPGCVGNGQHTEECRARIEQEMVDKGDAIKLETSGNQEENVPEPDVISKKEENCESDINPGGASSLTQTHPRGENLSKDPVQEMRIYWRGALRLSTNFFVTRHLSTSAEIALH